MNNPESCSIISLANSKLFLMLSLLAAIGSKIGTKFLAILQDGNLIADKMDRRGGQLSIKLLRNLEPLGFSFFYSVSEMI